MSVDAIRMELPDRVRLPLAFDPEPLATDLNALAADDWIDHVVRHNYDGIWRVAPLRAAAGEIHRLRMAIPDPSAAEFVDTPVLARLPHVRAALARFRCPLRSVRLMRLGAGSQIKEHCDPGLDSAMGWARLHIPIETDDGVEFLVNRRPVPMAAGSVWYLRLLDPHSVANRGARDRTHLVVDAHIDAWLADLLRRGAG